MFAVVAILVIVMENRIIKLSPNSGGVVCNHFQTNASTKGMNTTYFLLTMSKIVLQTGPLSFGRVTSLGRQH